MKRFLVIALAALAALTVVATDPAEARRLGGGRSLGTQRQAIPAPVAPARPNAAPSSATAPVQGLPPGAARPASGASRWLGPLAGLAAGIGLAALLSHFGLSGDVAGILMLAFLVFGGLFLIRLFLARRAVAPLRYAGAGTDPGAIPGASRSMPPATLPTAHGLDSVEGAAAATTANASVAGRFPPDFDPAPFLKEAKLQFRKLQSAYDSGDCRAMADVMTPEMYSEIEREIAERGTHVPTEVAELDAKVLEATTEGDRHWASVHFTGMLCEDGALLPKPFDEIWNLVKPVDGKSGWLLAGIRQPA